MGATSLGCRKKNTHQGIYVYDQVSIYEVVERNPISFQDSQLVVGAPRIAPPSRPCLAAPMAGLGSGRPLVCGQERPGVTEIAATERKTPPL